jgi:hypothetical protein
MKSIIARLAIVTIAAGASIAYLSWYSSPPEPQYIIFYSDGNETVELHQEVPTHRQSYPVHRGCN